MLSVNLKANSSQSAEVNHSYIRLKDAKYLQGDLLVDGLVNLPY